jgi:myo-inositol catabolism protein IolC
MNIGYNRALYLLPFDHRQSYVSGMFGFEPPLMQEQHDKVADSKQLIYEGFRQALADGVAKEHAGLLVDEEFGAAILRDAAGHGYTTALSTEKSGSDEFEFEYGADFAAHLEAFNPTFAKVLVRYNPDGDAALNQRQSARLRQLSDVCHQAGRRFMFELLVPATKAQLQQVQGDKDAYDRQARPQLMLRAIRSLQEAGVEPDIWKIEGLERREDCLRIVDTARRDGRAEVGCIVLGRGADEQKVTEWLMTAATVPGYVGFAVGRTSFWDAVKDYESGQATRKEAGTRIAGRYAAWAAIFERERQAAAAGDAP